MGTMFLAVRVIDAFDVGIGAVTDRTRTKLSFVTYLLWFAIPFGVMCMLTFYTPDFSLYRQADLRLLFLYPAIAVI